MVFDFEGGLGGSALRGVLEYLFLSASVSLSHVTLPSVEMACHVSLFMDAPGRRRFWVAMYTSSSSNPFRVLGGGSQDVMLTLRRPTFCSSYKAAEDLTAQRYSSHVNEDPP